VSLRTLIDCPLWWSSARSSDRLADKWLRAQGVPSGTVQTANSLRGAALVQGMMFAFRARERYIGVPITEAHPKPLLRVTCTSSLGIASQENLALVAKNHLRNTSEMPSWLLWLRATE
jgi:hypothetical protein